MIKYIRIYFFVFGGLAVLGQMASRLDRDNGTTDISSGGAYKTTATGMSLFFTIIRLNASIAFKEDMPVSAATGLARAARRPARSPFAGAIFAADMKLFRS
ncbi:hypothetical protein K449DRAFT_428696 [Hypoxylon sp. EC38]|nr:hypothetical protein K449DRAFT_428696 [Hypoxylon sp. EC38]